MGRFAHNDVLDAALLLIKNNSTRIVLCLAQPTNFTEANSVYRLAAQPVTPADFTIHDDETAGRQMNVAAKPGVPVTVQGVGNHTALLDVPNSRLLWVTPTSDTPVLAGGSVDLSSWEIEIGDPIAD